MSDSPDSKNRSDRGSVTDGSAVDGRTCSGRGAGMLLLAAVLLSSAAVWSCGRSDDTEQGAEVAADQPEQHEARIHGRVTVDEALDPTGDYGGITLMVLDPSAGPDTLFRSTTEQDGRFEGTARFTTPDIYLLEVHRSDNRLDDTTVVLGPQDTVRIEGMLPHFSGQAHIASTENDAMRTLNRLERQYNRIVQIAAAGGIPQDTIPDVLENWSDIFWQVYEENTGTVAANVAARESLQMLQEANPDKLMRRLREHGDDEWIRLLAARFGFVTEMQRYGLDAGLAWLDSLEAATESQQTRRRIAQNRIEVLYDSARTEEARSRMRDYEQAFEGDPDAERWLDVIRYDVDHLASGDPIPDFRMDFLSLTGGDVFHAFDLPGADPLGDFGALPAQPIGPEELRGSPAMIEVVSLTDRGYQASYNQLRTYYMIFQDEGIRFLTIPVEENPVTVGAFFNDRGQDWPVARAGAYAASDLEERWNIYDKPVRFLLDSDGRIVRKLHGHSVNELFIQINRLLTNGEIL
ncbi:TlpA family protein disulfide reductase [Natronogracilivirga saccharolytica]|uniref:Redoxin domain-containing protein n=1 Tax=Natronogracilivirga saccharolytica TaxID=2812953 RepID=A0A8J7UTF6_9BACT|nr:hypothetical protein [Natronogracilivirga saccharolytica]MBP3192561.1 hypothetical protein [Natronogracilivirga saccharolytica]